MGPQECVRALFAAYNAGDTDAALACMHPEIFRREPAEYPSTGTFRTFSGLKELHDHLSMARINWAEGSCEPKEFIVSSDKLVVYVHVRVRLKNKTEWNEGQTGEVFAFKDGKILEWHTFWEQQEALAWATSQLS